MSYAFRVNVPATIALTIHYPDKEPTKEELRSTVFELLAQAFPDDGVVTTIAVEPSAFQPDIEKDLTVFPRWCHLKWSEEFDAMRQPDKDIR